MKSGCRDRDSNPDGTSAPGDFKSPVSAIPPSRRRRVRHPNLGWGDGVKQAQSSRAALSPYIEVAFSGAEERHLEAFKRALMRPLKSLDNSK